MITSLRTRPELLHRHDLVEGLLAHREVPCVVLCAGAGYGKSTLARQWADADPRPAAWVAVDEEDRDPVVLLRKVLGSLHESNPPPDEGAARGTTASLDRMVSGLSAALEGDHEPFLLILDDVHLAAGRQSAGLLERLICLVPVGSQIALCGRSEPPIHLARRILSGDVFHLGQAELAFTDAEARIVVRQTLAQIDDDALRSLVSWAEGWPAGLHLALLALDDGSDAGESVALWKRADRRMTEYFREEVLERMPESVRSFLIRTSILDRLSGPLCDAVLDESGSGPLLEELASSENLFVVACGSDREWFRCHHMFADLLQAELRRAAPHDEVLLRRRAAGWLQLHGEGNAAFRQSMAAGDLDLAAEVVYQNLFPAIDDGRLATLELWLQEFSPPDIRQRATLALAAGWLALVSGRAGETEHWLEVVEHYDDGEPLPDGTASVTVAWAALAMSTGHGGIKMARRSARTVREAGPDGSPWWTLSVLIEAVAVYLAGESPDAVKLFECAEFALRGSGLLHPIALAYLALAHMARNESGNQRFAQQAVDEIREGGLEDVGILSVVHCVHALDAANRGASDESLAAAEKASGIMDRADPAPRSVILQGLILAEAAHRRGDDQEAATRLARAEALLPAEPDAVVLSDWVDQLAEQISSQEGSQQILSDLGITEAERRVLLQLPTCLSLEDIGHHLFISRNTVKSHVVSIYRKLRVSGRSAAVNRAERLDLLHDPSAGPKPAT